MSLKSKAKKSAQKSKSAIGEEDHAFSLPLFEQLAHFDQEYPEGNPIAPLNRSQAANTDHVDRELQLVQLQKEKLALELEVLQLRQSTVLPLASTNLGSTANASVKKESLIGLKILYLKIVCDR